MLSLVRRKNPLKIKLVRVYYRDMKDVPQPQSPLKRAKIFPENMWQRRVCWAYRKISKSRYAEACIPYKERMTG